MWVKFQNNLKIFAGIISLYCNDTCGTR